MKPNKQKTAFRVFKELFLNPGLPATYRNLASWAEQEGYIELALEC